MASFYKYVVLGGGNASGYAAKEFVGAGGQAGELCIITDEAVVAYERPALTKGFLIPTVNARLPGFHTCVGGGGERQDPDWYAKHGIEYLTGSAVTSVDLASKSLKLGSGKEITYEKLIIATGARSTKLSDFQVPGAELEGVYYLRNVADGLSFVDAVKSAKEAGHTKIVLIGGGYIGMEVAAAIHGYDLDITILLPEPYLMQRLFTPELGEFYGNFYASKGIKILTEQKLVRLEGSSGKVESVVYTSLAGGPEISIPADLVVAGIGARANVELFKGQLDIVLGGIKVDAHLQASVPDVYAVGDVASFPLVLYDGAVGRHEHVTHCRSSAAHAIKEVLGTHEEYKYLPHFYSRVFNLAWIFWGSNKGQAVFFGDKDAGKVGTYWVDGGKVVGAFLESGTPDENNAIKAVAAARPAAPANLEELAVAGMQFALSKI